MASAAVLAAAASGAEEPAAPAGPTVAGRPEEPAAADGAGETDHAEPEDGDDDVDKTTEVPATAAGRPGPTAG